MSTEPNLLSEVPGGPELIAWFGSTPRFHDAEILELHLDRSGESHLRIHTWQMTTAIDERGHYVLDKHVVVTFTFSNITGLQLDGFSGQNVISGLEVKRYGRGNDVLDKPLLASAEPDAQDYALVLDHCYGLAGTICARELHVSFAPGTPQTRNAR